MGEINDELDTLSSDVNNQVTQTMLRAIQRHRDVHQDNFREFRRTKVRWLTCSHSRRLTVQQTSVKQALDQMNLLSGVRNDIEYARAQLFLIAVVLTTHV